MRVRCEQGAFGNRSYSWTGRWIEFPSINLLRLSGMRRMITIFDRFSSASSLARRRFRAWFTAGPNRSLVTDLLVVFSSSKAIPVALHRSPRLTALGVMATWRLATCLEAKRFGEDVRVSRDTSLGDLLERGRRRDFAFRGHAAENQESIVTARIASTGMFALTKAAARRRRHRKGAHGRRGWRPRRTGSPSSRQT